MPQMNKGGKFVFGQSVIRPDGLVRLPTQAAEEYHIASEGELLPYKGRAYCWTGISKADEIKLTKKMMTFLHLTPEMRLLSIRSSDIAFTMGAKGPLLDKAANYCGKIPLY